jgi:hypothetical protein
MGKNELSLCVRGNVETDRIAIRGVSAVTAGWLRGRLRNGQKAEESRRCRQTAEAFRELFHLFPNRRSQAIATIYQRHGNEK